MFEKIHSYQLKQDLLEEISDMFKPQFLLPITKNEKAWLKSVLCANDVINFIPSDTKQKLDTVLQEYESVNIDSLLLQNPKVDSQMFKDINKDIFQLIIKTICLGKRIQISYKTYKGGFFENVNAFPFRIEFNLKKKQWYLWWLPIDFDTKILYPTPIHLITEVSSYYLNTAKKDKCLAKIKNLVEQERVSVVLAINNKAFKSPDEDKGRILYAFSSFDKEVKFDTENNSYEIVINYRRSEEEDVLQKIRMIGERIIVKNSPNLQRRMKETICKTLNLYKNKE